MIPEPFRLERDGADGLVAGFYLLRSEGRVDIPIHIWFGAPKDPETGDVLDRSHRWQVEVGGIDASDADFPPLIWGREMQALDDIWPRCARFPTTAADYAFRVERADWAEAYDQQDAFGTRSGRVDPMTTTLPFFD